MNSLIKTKAFLVDKIWGGQKLAQFKPGSEVLELALGETWEVSNLKEGSSECSFGKLSEIFSHEQIPYLIKFLDTSDHLSVQVHPGDEYARKVEDSFGKTECWLILDAEEEAGIYLGFKEGVSKEGFQKAIEDKDDLSKLLNFYPVKKGEFFYVPSGTVHAIGKGVTLCEVQQSSGVTYRVWDWNRVDKEGRGRELHIEKALDVLNFEKAHNQLSFFKHQANDLSLDLDLVLVEHPDFKVRLISKENEVELNLENQRVSSLIHLGRGSLKIDQGSEKLELETLSSALITKSGALRLNAQGERVCVLLVQ